MIYMYETAVLGLMVMVLSMSFDMWQGRDRAWGILFGIVFCSLFAILAAIPFIPDNSVPDVRTGPATVVKV